MTIEFFPMESYPYELQEEKLVNVIKEGLSEEERKILDLENILMRLAHENNYADEVDALNGIDNNYTKTLEPPANLINIIKKGKFYRNVLIGNLIEDAASIFFVKDPSGTIGIGIPIFNFNDINSFAVVSINYNYLVRLFNQPSSSGSDLKKIATAFKFSPDPEQIPELIIKMASAKNSVDQVEKNFEVAEAFKIALEQLKNDRSKAMKIEECKKTGYIGNYNVFCINLKNKSFIMPGRVIAKLDELASGLKNKDPEFANIIPQELKDSFLSLPGATDERMQDLFIEALYALYVERYLSLRIANIVFNVANYFRTSASEVLKRYFEKYPEGKTRYNYYLAVTDKDKSEEFLFSRPSKAFAKFMLGKSSK